MPSSDRLACLTPTPAPVCLAFLQEVNTPGGGLVEVGYFSAAIRPVSLKSELS